MQSPDPFNSFIIREGTLTIQCREILLNRGHEIRGIISLDASVNRWAQEKNIPHAEPTDAQFERKDVTADSPGPAYGRAFYSLHFDSQT